MRLEGKSNGNARRECLKRRVPTAGQNGGNCAQVGKIWTPAHKWKKMDVDTRGETYAGPGKTPVVTGFKFVDTFGRGFRSSVPYFLCRIRFPDTLFFLNTTRA